MNYNKKRVAVTGTTGFLGNQIYLELIKAGAEVYALNGDIRDPKTFDVLDYSFDYLFHFGAPSSQVLFKRQAMYAADVTLNGFINAAKVCKENGIKLIYPSTGLLSQNKENSYARVKRICEEIHEAEKLDAIAIRIFATYGPWEGHKRDYASVPFLFIRDQVRGKQSIVFGDGNQKRDFIYIDDVVQSVLHIAEEFEDTRIDVGSGEAHTFNEIFEIIKQVTNRENKIKYIEKPGGYVDETLADPHDLHVLYTPKTTFKEGITNVIKYTEESYRNDDNQSAD